MFFPAASVALAACLSLALAKVPTVSRNPVMPKVQVDVSVTNGTGFFDQFIDHAQPHLGTFKQKFWWSDQYFKGPGSPIVLFTPGEIAAEGYEGYLTNRTLTGAIAQSVNGATILLEHRYYGESSPFQDLSVKNLQYLTLKNAIADMNHFARNVELPFDKDCKSNAPRAPWVLAGGSYSGALSAWTEATSPGTFWAYHASSAPVEAISDYWQYFYPVQQGMPSNCSADVTKVVAYVDSVLTGRDQTAKNDLKAKFGLTGLRDTDFAAAIENGPWLWQGNSFTTGYSSFFQWCDYVENAVPFATAAGKNSTIFTPTAAGVGLTRALEGYASYIRTQFVPDYCSSTFGYWTDKNDLGCFDTYNAKSLFFTDKAVNNTANRQWNWMLCNEPFGYWQDGAPKDKPTIVSRLVDAAYWQRQCALFFPTETSNGQTYTYGSNKGRTVDTENQFTEGWNPTNTKRLMWVNGEFDPWRTSGVSSQFRPGGELKSTSNAPVFMLPHGYHCSDLNLKNSNANPALKAVVDQEIAQMKSWVGEFYGGVKSRRTL